MSVSQEEKESIKLKWINIYVHNCPFCNGKRVYEGHTCNCEKQAMHAAIKELSNIPLVAFDYSEAKVDYDLTQYVNSLSNIGGQKLIKNLYMQGFSYANTMNIVGYIAENLLNIKSNIKNDFLSMHYCLYEDLIQYSLRSNIDRDAASMLDKIYNYYDVLFIDDIGLETGVQSQTKHNARLLHGIIKRRTNKTKATILFSKLNLNQIENNYSEEVMTLITQSFDVVTPLKG